MKLATILLPLLGALGIAVPVFAWANDAAAPAARQQPATGQAAKAPRAPDAKLRRAFAEELAAESNLAAQSIEDWLAEARIEPSIIQAMDRPRLQPPKWYEYAPPLLSQARVSEGVAWWNAHAADLSRAQAEFGVPAGIIAAIVGVETRWGRNLGRYRALDALATLTFAYPRRASFFRDELKAFLLLARDQGMAPDAPLGSFAGALGMPQFMPGSYRRFALDYDNDGRVDLWRSNADVIGSVARFLVEHGWRRGEPALLPAMVADDARAAAMARLDGGLSEQRSLTAWLDEGVTPVGASTPLADTTMGLLLLEDGPDASSLDAARENFYVIMRYNKSRLYAAVVVELAAALEAARVAENQRSESAVR
jgi:membrane-bound lytic murein transglycosylase B